MKVPGIIRECMKSIRDALHSLKLTCLFNGSADCELDAREINSMVLLLISNFALSADWNISSDHDSK